MSEKYAELNIDEVLDLIKHGHSNEITLPFNTEINGTHYFINTSYNRGCINYFSGQHVKRGFYLFITKGGIAKNSSEIEFGHGLGMCIRTVGRYSKKQSRIVQSTWGHYLPKLIESYKEAKMQGQAL